MSTRNQQTKTFLALLLILSLCHLSLGTALASTGLQATGKLVTRGNQAITVNGISTSSGATILSGASVETPDQVGATINLGDLGSLDIAPNTKLQLEFSRDGGVKVTVVEGCVILRVKQGNYGEINTPEGKATSNDLTQKQAATLDVCNPKGAPAAIVNQGAAANAGAGAGTVGTVGEEGLSTAAVTSLVLGGIGIGVLAIVAATRGDDPSGSS
jgi:hypothetical protein